MAAPPYDVIDAAQRAELVGALAAQRGRDRPAAAGGDPYAHAAEVFERWQREGVLVRDEQPAIWALAQDYTGPDGVRRTRHGLFARVGVEDYGPGRIRPHERTHPGPKEDRLRLTRATKANLSPIFSSTTTRPGRRGARSRRTSRAPRGARSPTRTAPCTGSGASPTRPAVAAVKRRARPAPSC